MLWDLSHLTCRDLTELGYLAASIYPKYHTSKLTPAALCSKMMSLRDEKGNFLDLFECFCDMFFLVNKLEFELPRDCKFLLIAAYLASYNSPKHDKRLFSLAPTSKTRTAAVKVKDTFPGPKIFSIQRLLAIYQSISDTKWNHGEGINVELSSQISMLTGLKLLSPVSPPSSCDPPRFKCSVSFHFISLLANSLPFNLSAYLLS